MESPLTVAELWAKARSCRWAVQASTAADGRPQAAVIGVAVSELGEVFFDTLGTTRKAANLRRDGRAAIVIGWDEYWTIQLSGVADEPQGADLARLTALYLAAFPDGVERQSWPGITYFRVRPTWARFSDFRVVPPLIVEFTERELSAGR